MQTTIDRPMQTRRLSLPCRPAPAGATSLRRWWLAFGHPRPAGRLALSALLTAAVCWAGQPALRAQGTGVLTTLHTFPRDTGISSSNLVSVGALIQGSDGNFYGATSIGPFAEGTLFRMTPAGEVTTLHIFSGSDGVSPAGPLLQGSDGNFYGTTRFGGAAYTGRQTGYGTVFRLTPDGALTTLHSFTGDDGKEPLAGLVQGSDGGFYGTTVGNGTSGAEGTGTVFQITPGGTLRTLYTFGGSDGRNPAAPLVQAGDGSFYGTTSAGGASLSNGSAYGDGTIFRISPAGALTTLHSFTKLVDGQIPSGLAQGSDGSFYGTTEYGGTYPDVNGGDGYGTVFRITPAGEFTTLHNFTNGGDGARPRAELVHGSDGSFYGTTESGGPVYQGTVFQFTPAGALTPLYYFRNGGDGGHPSVGLVQGNDGSFYGTTGFNTAFRLVVTPHPAFFTGQIPLSDGVYFLGFSNGNPFGYYSFLSDPAYIYHQDLGYEYVFDANDGKDGVYLYDFKSDTFFYTSPGFPFPYLYDFKLNTVLYYYPDPSNAGRYNTNGYRFFYRFDTGQIITK